MSSPITLSNFNSIDFGSILNLVMQQESQPLQALQNQQTAVNAESSNYAALATRLGKLETAASDLATPDVGGSVATASDPAVSIATGTGTVPGRYEVVVNDLARAQVTATTGTSPDVDQTIVADAGTITIGGTTVTLNGPTTLSGLASAINGTSGIAVNASVIQSSPGAYKLVLTGSQTGAANAFTIDNQLTGGIGVGFGGNATEASDASVTINHIPITSSSNTLTTGIPGVTLTLNATDPAKTIAVTVSRDDSAFIKKVQAFASAYNDIVSFQNDQMTAAKNGSAGTIASDSLLRTLRTTLRTALTAAYGSGSLTHLSMAGVGFQQDGTLSVDTTQLSQALTDNRGAVTTLFGGDGTSGNAGAFGALQALIHDYTQTGGLIAGARDERQRESSRLDAQISDMQDRLAVRRTALQAEYTAADQAMTQLKAQSGGLSSLGGSSGLFTNM